MASGPAIKNIVIYRGVKRILRFGPIKDAAGATLDVAGWTTQLTLRTTETAPDPPSFQKAGVIFGPTVNGIIDVVITLAESVALKARDYAYSFERTNIDNEDILTIGIASVKYDIKNPK
jgi:hypothetical protein